MVWTTVPKTVTSSQILDLYRLRWQIELVFKRMKSILGLGHLPKTDPLSAQAWLQGKIFVGLLIERMLHTAKLISPWATPWQPRRSRWREIEFLYHQVGAALLLPQSLSTVLLQLEHHRHTLAETPRSDGVTPFIRLTLIGRQSWVGLTK